MSVREIMQDSAFRPSTQDVLNLGVSASSFWIRFKVANESAGRLALELSQPSIDFAALYTVSGDSVLAVIEEGEHLPFSARQYKHQNYIFDLKIPPGEEREFLLKVRSLEQISLPLYIGNMQDIYESLLHTDIIFGVFFGIILVMFLYNLFLYFTVRDSSYLY